MTAPVALEPRLADDLVLKQFRVALDVLYGARLERVVLFGSRARGDHRPDSDYDIAVFIEAPGILTEELNRLAEIATEILDEDGAVINPLPLRARSHHLQTGFMQELRADGRDI